VRSEIAGLTIGFVKSDSVTRRYASTAAVHADERRPGETSLRTSVERAVGRSLESNVTTGSFVGVRRPSRIDTSLVSGGAFDVCVIAAAKWRECCTGAVER